MPILRRKRSTATLLRSARTQVSPAMAQFGIRYIAGYSSEARGRFERASEHSGTACPRCWPWPASLQCKTSKRIVTFTLLTIFVAFTISVSINNLMLLNDLSNLCFHTRLSDSNQSRFLTDRYERSFAQLLWAGRLYGCCSV